MTPFPLHWTLLSTQFHHFSHYQAIILLLLLYIRVFYNVFHCFSLMSLQNIVWAVYTAHIGCRLLQLTYVFEAFPFKDLFTSNSIVFCHVSQGVKKFDRTTFRKVKCHPVFTWTLACVCIGNEESSSLYFKLICSAYCDWIAKQHIIQLFAVHLLISE